MTLKSPQRYSIIAKTLKGLENVLAEEIREIGGENIKILRRAVSFEGTDAILYKANMALRTALRLIVPFTEFDIRNENELYLKVKEIPWDEIISLEQTFVIDTVVNSPIFNNSHFVALRIKDAIVDVFAEKHGKRPSISKSNADIYLDVYLFNETVIISLDSSGISLDKRGYRLRANEAPINEVLAAGIILLSNWDKKSDFYDPMAGSGTFCIEAGHMSIQKAPNLYRNFSFFNWPDYDESLFYSVKKELEEKIITTDTKIFARDIEANNIDIIAENIERAELDDIINLKKEDFFLSKPLGESGHIVINPPYGTRLRPEAIALFYKQMGDTLKQNYPGHEAWIISSNLEMLKLVGLKPDKKIQLMNGGLESKLHQYTLIKGKKLG